MDSSEEQISGYIREQLVALTGKEFEFCAREDSGEFSPVDEDQVFERVYRGEVFYLRSKQLLKYPIFAVEKLNEILMQHGVLTDDYAAIEAGEKENTGRVFLPFGRDFLRWGFMTEKSFSSQSIANFFVAAEHVDKRKTQSSSPEGGVEL